LRLEELAIFTVLYDLHFVILCCRSVESVSECFLDNRVP
jgi:hypothetical protein